MLKQFNVKPGFCHWEIATARAVILSFIFPNAVLAMTAPFKCGIFSTLYQQTESNTSVSPPIKVLTKKLIISLVLAFCLHSLGAQTPQYRVVHWGVDNGLSQGTNQRIIKDRSGFIWITSFEGINRFDGKTFRSFFSSSKERHAIRGVETTGLLEDSLGRIWFGSGYGLNCYDPIADSVKHLFVSNQQQNNYIIPITTWKNEVVCLTINNELLAFDISSFHSRILSRNIAWSDNYKNAANSYVNPSTSSLYFPVSRGIAKINLQSGIRQEFLSNYTCSSIRYDREKHVFLIGTDQGLLQWTEQETKLLPIPLTAITAIEQAAGGQWWIGTEEMGLYILGANGESLHLNKTDLPGSSINSNKINSIYCSEEGTGWLGVGTNGIDQLVPNTRFAHFFRNPKLNNGLSGNIVRSFAEDEQENIWIASDEGINIFNRQTQEFSRFSINLPRYFYKESPGYLWTATEKGLYKINTISRISEPIKIMVSEGKTLPAAYAEQIISFVDSTLLVATREYGLLQIDRIANTATQLKYPGDKHVFFIAYLNKLLFVSQWNDRLAVFKIEEGVWKAYKTPIEEFTVTHVWFDSSQKKYWIGTIQGLIEADEQLRILHHYTMNEGLPNHYIYALQPDGQGHIWISTNKGLSEFNINARTFRNYTPADGIQEYEYNAKAAFRASDGTIFFGGINGFDLISPFEESKGKLTASFYIKNLWINNIEYSGRTEVNHSDLIHLSYQQNNISIQTGIIDFLPKGSNRIRYMLKGAETEWRLADRDFVINYSGLAPGTYEFMAELTDDNSRTHHLHFIIEGPWWASVWVKIGSVLLLGAFVFWLFRSYYQRKFRKKQQALEKEQAIERERTRIATDMHDDLGSGLSRIRFISENMKWKTDRDRLEADIDKVNLYSKDMLDKMGEIVWALNEKNDTLGDLMAYTREYAAEYLSQHGIQCTVFMPDSLPQEFVRGEFRRNVFLVVKEALHNIVKHAQAKEVQINMKAGENLIISIGDNGKGFDLASIRSTGYGLDNMKNRIQVLGGTFKINTSMGTIIELEVPLL